MIHFRVLSRCRGGRLRHGLAGGRAIRCSAGARSRTSSTTPSRPPSASGWHRQYLLHPGAVGGDRAGRRGPGGGRAAVSPSGRLPAHRAAGRAPRRDDDSLRRRRPAGTGRGGRTRGRRLAGAGRHLHHPRRQPGVVADLPGPRAEPRGPPRRISCSTTKRPTWRSAGLPLADLVEAVFDGRRAEPDDGDRGARPRGRPAGRAAGQPARGGCADWPAGPSGERPQRRPAALGDGPSLASTIPAMASPLERLIRSFLDHLSVERGASAHTVAGYRRDLARYAGFLAARGVDRARGDHRARHHRLRGGPALGSDGHRALAPSSVARAVVAVRSLHRLRRRRRGNRRQPGRRRGPAAPGTATAQGAGAVPGPGACWTRPTRRPRWGCVTPRCWRCSTAPGRASPRCSPWTSTTWPACWPIRTPGSGCSARDARNGIVPVGSYARSALEAWLVRGRPGLVSRSRGTAGPAGELPRRPAQPAERLGRPAGPTPSARTWTSRSPAHPATLLRHPPARRRRRRPGGAGTAGPRLGEHHPDLHPGHRRTSPRGVPDRPPAGATELCAPSRLVDISGVGCARAQLADDPAPGPSGKDEVNHQTETDALFDPEPTLDAAELGPTGRPLPDLPEPTAPDPNHPKRALIIALCNQKGGVGKTTTTINLGAALAETGRKVLAGRLRPAGFAVGGPGGEPAHRWTPVDLRPPARARTPTSTT